MLGMHTMYASQYRGRDGLSRGSYSTRRVDPDTFAILLLPIRHTLTIRGAHPFPTLTLVTAPCPRRVRRAAGKDVFHVRFHHQPDTRPSDRDRRVCRDSAHHRAGEHGPPATR